MSYADPGTRRAVLAVVLASAFGAIWALIELIGEGLRVSPYQVVWTRYGTHLALVVLLFGFRRRSALVRTARPGMQVLASLCMLGMPVCFIAALGRMEPAEVMSVFWTAPLIVFAASLFLMRERPRILECAAILCGSAGAMLVTASHGSVFRAACVFPLGMASCFAGYMLVIRLLRRERLASKLFHTALWVFLVLSLALPGFWHTPSVHDLTAMAVIGVLGCLGLLALDRALELASVPIVAAAVCTQPVWVEILEHKWLGWTAVIGTGLVAASMVLCTTASYRSLSRRHPSAASSGATA